MRWIALSAAMLACSLAAAAAEEFSVVINGKAGSASIRHGERTIARVDLPWEVIEKYSERRRVREMVYVPCGYGQYCAYPAYASTRSEPKTRVLSGADIAFRDVNLPLTMSAGSVSSRKQVSSTTSNNDGTDQWLAHLKAGGSFEQNPASLVSTAALYAHPDSVRTASVDKPAGQTIISISRQGARTRISEIQNLLNRMGFHAGPADGVAGPATRYALAEFEYFNGMEPRGELTERTARAVFRAAGRKVPSGGELVVLLDGQTLLRESVEIADASTPLGLHVLFADGEEKSWRALSLSKGHRTAARTIFSSKDPAAILQRLSLSQKAQEVIAGSVGPGTVLVINDQPVASPGNT